MGIRRKVHLPHLVHLTDRAIRVASGTGRVFGNDPAPNLAGRVRDGGIIENESAKCPKEDTMKAEVGDRIVVEAEKVGQSTRTGVVEEVLTPQPPRLRVRWDDGHSTVFAPSAGAARIEPAKR
jgi:hypothetical protein